MKRDQAIEFKNYRDVADVMTRIGYTMNHSSVRNYILRMMRKFAQVYFIRNGIKYDAAMIDDVAQSQIFQQGIAEVLTTLGDNYAKEQTNDERTAKEPTAAEAGIGVETSKDNA